MAVVAVIGLLFFTIATISGQVLEESCKKQIVEFLECKNKIFQSDEQMERNNKTSALFKECYEKNGCMQSIDDLPHDEDWRRRKCGQDLSETVKQKVISCVRLRASPEFELPPKNDWAYGRYSYETVPLPTTPYLEAMCKKGDSKGVMKCIQEVANSTRMDDSFYKGYYEKACQRRADCFKILDETCLARYNTYRQTFCDCGYDVHELYGGKRLLTLTPSCAGFVSDKKTKFSTATKGRDSCLVEDLDGRDSMNKICKIGYEEFRKEMKEKLAAMSTTKSPTTPKRK